MSTLKEIVFGIGVGGKTRESGRQFVDNLPEKWRNRITESKVSNHIRGEKFMSCFVELRLEAADDETKQILASIRAAADTVNGEGKVA